MKRFSWLIALGFLASCSAGDSIFPTTDISTDAAVLPNPISIGVDTARNQIVVVNSNLDFRYTQGSISILSVDATNTTAPALTAEAVLETPSFAGPIVLNGDDLYLTFREESGGDDQIIHYTLGAGTITEDTRGTVCDNSYGLALHNNRLLVVCDDALQILDTNLNEVTTLNLKTALNASSNGDISDINSQLVENIAVDAASNRAFITNRSGEVLVVDLNTDTLTHVIEGTDDNDGPRNTRGIATDGTYMYVVDGNPPTLWVWDPAQLPASTGSIQAVEESTVLVGALDLGLNPNSITVDAATNRAYVANSTDDTVSVISLDPLIELTRVNLDPDRDDEGDLDDPIDEPFFAIGGTFNSVPYIFVANLTSSNLSVIHGQTFKPVTLFPED